MNKYYQIGEIKLLKENDIQNIEREISMQLPEEYKAFLKTYGYGSFNGYLIIDEPDKDYFRLNFEEFLFLWDLSKNEETLITDGVNIISNIDGDLVLLIKNTENPFVLLPKGSEQVIYFQKFTEVIDYFLSKLEEEIYFESNHENKIQTIEMLVNGKINLNIIDSIHRYFIENIPFDKVINGQQPVYIIQNIGGWVRFDLAYKNSITIKYQHKFEAEAKKIIEMINKKL